MPQIPENPDSSRVQPIRAARVALRHSTAFGRRALGIDGRSPRPSVAAVLHGDEVETAGLNAQETAQLRGIRRFGATGAVLMAVGALGAGAQPVLQNPVQGLRFIGLPARIPSVALTLTMTGTVMIVLAWLLLGRFAIGNLQSGPVRRLNRSQLDRTLLLWVIPLSVAPPMFSKDVYSYLAQSEIASRGSIRMPSVRRAHSASTTSSPGPFPPSGATPRTVRSPFPLDGPGNQCSDR